MVANWSNSYTIQANMSAMFVIIIRYEICRKQNSQKIVHSDWMNSSCFLKHRNANIDRMLRRWSISKWMERLFFGCEFLLFSLFRLFAFASLRVRVYVLFKWCCFAMENASSTSEFWVSLKNKFRPKLNLEKWFRLEHFQSPVGPVKLKCISFIYIERRFSPRYLITFMSEMGERACERYKKEREMRERENERSRRKNELMSERRRNPNDGKSDLCRTMFHCDCTWPSKNHFNWKPIVLVQRMPNVAAIHLQ